MLDSGKEYHKTCRGPGKMSPAGLTYEHGLTSSYFISVLICPQVDEVVWPETSVGSEVHPGS